MKYLKLPLPEALGTALVISGRAGADKPHIVWLSPVAGYPVLQSRGATVDQMAANLVHKHNLPGITMVPWRPRAMTWTESWDAKRPCSAVAAWCQVVAARPGSIKDARVLQISPVAR
jgi:hypothetical protein